MNAALCYENSDRDFFNSDQSSIQYNVNIKDTEKAEAFLLPYIQGIFVACRKILKSDASIEFDNLDNDGILFIIIMLITSYFGVENLPYKINNFLSKANHIDISKKELFKLYGILDDFIMGQNFEEYSTILDRVSVSNTNITLMIGLLRLPYLYRSKIASWEKFLNKVKQELEYRGRDPKRLLMGLL